MSDGRSGLRHSTPPLELYDVPRRCVMLVDGQVCGREWVGPSLLPVAPDEILPRGGTCESCSRLADERTALLRGKLAVSAPTPAREPLPVESAASLNPDDADVSYWWDR